MIDWWQVGEHALWILGFAVLLASYSYRSYITAQQQNGPREKAGRQSIGFFGRLGLLLVSAGLGLTSNALFQRVLWGIVGLLILIDVVRSLLRRQPEPPPTQSVIDHGDHMHRDI